MAYYDATNGNLEVARCNDRACAGANETRTAVDMAGDVGAFPSLALGLDGKPVIAYYDATNGDLRFARCNDAACAGRNEALATLDASGDVGRHAAVAIGLDGIPVVAYHDETNGMVKIARPAILR